METADLSNEEKENHLIGIPLNNLNTGDNADDKITTNILEESSRETFLNKYDKYIIFIAATLSTSIYSHSERDRGLIPFVLIYLAMMILVGFPLLLLEISIGQQLRQGIITMWRASPICRGIGFLTILQIISSLLVLQTFTTYALHFTILATFYSDPPWASCNNTWNDYKCHRKDFRCEDFDSEEYGGYNHNITDIHATDKYDRIYDGQHVCFLNETTVINSWEIESSTGQYLSHNVIGEIHNISSPEVVPLNILFLFISWSLLFIATCRGFQKIHQSLIITVVISYLLFVVFGIYFLVYGGKNIVWWSSSMFFDYHIYISILATVVYQLSLGHGMLITMGSRLKYKDNTFKLSLIVTVIQIITTIISAMIGSSMRNTVIRTNPLHYPYSGFSLFTSVSEFLNGISGSTKWIAVVLLAYFNDQLGLGILIVGTLLISITDAWPKLRGNQVKLAATLCAVGFLINILFVCKNSARITSIMISMFRNAIYVCILECLFISVAYGHKRFLKNVKEMYGINQLTTWCYWSWIGITPPLLLICVLSDVIPYGFYGFGMIIRFGLYITPFFYAIGLYLHKSTLTFKSIYRPETY